MDVRVGEVHVPPSLHRARSTSSEYLGERREGRLQRGFHESVLAGEVLVEPPWVKPASFITSPTLAPSMPRSRSSRDALATIRAWLLSFSAWDIRMSIDSRLIRLDILEYRHNPYWITTNI
ncbi:hypothetical protein NIIDMKKI_53700 [Mycobacterium kansasii]|uniref:Uncharacterized protein n=1 Tax=Mycobacterium kansasii TaxID=1768 RepID=A0A7G1II91_MYCKA|nr:hypothetical protein NIIDMKKI_53700 [Mycobacterium kansasii]